MDKKSPIPLYIETISDILELTPPKIEGENDDGLDVKEFGNEEGKMENRSRLNAMRDYAGDLFFSCIGDGSGRRNVESAGNTAATAGRLAEPG